MENFGQLLSYLRRKKGLKQAEIADLVGVSSASWSDYERGKTEPNLSILSRMSEKLQVSTDMLLGINQKNAHLFRSTLFEENHAKSAPNSTPNSTPNEEKWGVSQSMVEEPQVEYKRITIKEDNAVLTAIGRLYTQISDLEHRLSKIEQDQ